MEGWGLRLHVFLYPTEESSQLAGGGRKGGPKTAKPQNRTEIHPKAETASAFSRMPKPQVHQGHNMKDAVSQTCKLI